MLEEESADQPEDFITTTRAHLLSPNILKQIIAEIDPRLTKNVETVERGFRVIVGHVWEIVNKSTETIVDWLRLIFLPLVKTAASASPKPEREGSEARRMQREERDLAFLKNLRDVQLSDLRYSPMSTQMSESDYSPPAIPAFDLQSLSPLNPDVLTRGPPITTPSRVLEFHKTSTDPGAFWSPSRIDEELPERLGDESVVDSDLLRLDSPTAGGSSIGWLPPLQSAFELKTESESNSTDANGTITGVLVVLGPSRTPWFSRADFEDIWGQFIVEPEDEDLVENTAGPSKGLATPEPASEVAANFSCRRLFRLTIPF
ncbi:hypothetical protein B0H13DRAFT_1957408 [Mycena leptocephala]|nr:hypothetical protein B0H13DRAFT_1957408 [Mycena leptocephala]